MPPNPFQSHDRFGGGWWVLCPSGSLRKRDLSSAALQGRTEYGPRVCADKARARCRRDIGPTSLRQPPPRPTLLTAPHPPPSSYNPHRSASSHSLRSQASSPRETQSPPHPPS